VYLGEIDDAHGGAKRVAIKPSSAPLDRAAVRERGRLIAGLDHPSLLRIEDYAQFREQPAVVWEFVDGLNFGELLDLEPKLSARVALEALSKSCSALSAAWEQTPLGVRSPIYLPHGNLDFDRLMLTRDGHFKLLGFGPEVAPTPDNPTTTWEISTL
jgi:hypothetical protein